MISFYLMILCLIWVLLTYLSQQLVHVLSPHQMNQRHRKTKSMSGLSIQAVVVHNKVSKYATAQSANPFPENLLHCPLLLYPRKCETGCWKIHLPMPLSCIIGPLVEMHVDETAKPKTYHTAAPIPLHWQNHVLKDLE